METTYFCYLVPLAKWQSQFVTKWAQVKPLDRNIQQNLIEFAFKLEQDPPQSGRMQLYESNRHQRSSSSLLDHCFTTASATTATSTTIATTAAAFLILLSICFLIWIKMKYHAPLQQGTSNSASGYFVSLWTQKRFLQFDKTLRNARDPEIPTC